MQTAVGYVCTAIVTVDWSADKAVIKAMEYEGVDYCAICWKCVKELQEKGEEK